MIGLYIAIGAASGAILRWSLSMMMNSVFPTIPLGTLSANILGGFLMGIFIGITKNHAFISESMRLLIVTGFLGSLTTFSTFSAETVNLFLSQQYFWSGLIIIGHVVGSLLATISGIYLVRFCVSIGS